MGPAVGLLWLDGSSISVPMLVVCPVFVISPTLAACSDWGRNRCLFHLFIQLLTHILTQQYHKPAMPYSLNIQAIRPNRGFMEGSYGNTEAEGKLLFTHHKVIGYIPTTEDRLTRETLQQMITRGFPWPVSLQKRRLRENTVPVPLLSAGWSHGETEVGKGSMIWSQRQSKRWSEHGLLGLSLHSGMY